MNAKGVSILKKLYVEKERKDSPSVNASLSEELLLGNKRFLDTESTKTKRRKMDNQQQVSELQDCTLPCSVKGQCISPKRRKLENISVTFEENTSNTQLLQGSQNLPSDISMQFEGLADRTESVININSEMPVYLFNSVAVEPVNNKNLKGNKLI